MNKTSQLEQLKKLTRVAADTADFETMRAYNAQEGTTNPSLILAAAQKPDYGALLDRAVNDLKGEASSSLAKADAVMDNLLISLYEKQGVSRERVLIKIAATWEGIKRRRNCRKNQ